MTHLLGHESRGSLLSLFKNAGWANRLACGVSRPAAGICSLILSIDLTLKGLGELIISYISYLQLLLCLIIYVF